MPKISVIIPVYNSEQYLASTLDSILSQTFTDFELICVDDGSTDDSLSILKEYANRDSRVRLLSCDEKSDGAAAPRNMGIHNATGDYLSILDSDDLFEPDMLETAYTQITATDSDLVIYDGWIYDDRTGEDGDADFILCRQYLPPFKDTFSPGENVNDLFQMGIGAAWGGMYRRSFIMENGIRFHPIKNADDFGFVYLAFACASRISIIDRQLIHYRMFSGTSQSTKTVICTDSYPKALGQLRDDLVSRGLYEKYKVSFGQFVVNYGGFYLDSLLKWPLFRDFYHELKDVYFKEFDIYEMRDTDFREEFWAGFRNRIRDLSPEEFIFQMIVPEDATV